MSGEAGNFEIELLQHPRYVDEDKCIACGLCVEKCPSKIPDSYNMGLEQRKAIHVEYAQAVPLKYRIDPAHCIYLTKGKCGNCAKVCQSEAVDYEQKEISLTLNVGAVVLAPGFQPFDPSGFGEYRYSDYANVITSMEFERILSPSGPTMGHVTTRAKKNEKEPKKIAWLQCVGSREVNRCDNAYCSSVCCMYAIKEAVIAKEHAGDDLDCAIFHMDMRTHGKDFEKYYDNARDRHNIRFVRSRIQSIVEDPATNDLIVKYPTEDGELVTEIFDMVVLSVGMQASEETVQLAGSLGIDLTPGNFCKSSSFDSAVSSKEGIFACGSFQGPKDIPQCVVDASAAAASVGEMLSPARGTLVEKAVKVPETDIGGIPPRIGVFVCHCGTNIAGVVDVKAVAEYAETLPYVSYVTQNLYACSQDAQDKIVDLIREKGLNRVVVAACTPKTHEPLFQETIVNGGLNRYLFEMANIRNQDSWVHKDVPDRATQKAMDLVRMAVSKSALTKPLEEAELTVNQSAMVVGGGISGMTAAASLARQGYETHLIEKNGSLGGQALQLYRTAGGESVQTKLSELINSINENSRIHVHLDATVTSTEGFVGNFTSTFSSGENESVIEYGVAVIATGASASQTDEYEFGQDERIITSLELDRRLIEYDAALQDTGTAVFIQCVGSREPDRPYCSRVCCTHSIQNALELKKLKPEMNVYILYRDIRSYGERELLYRDARQAGVIFIRYTVESKPVVSTSGDSVDVTVVDHVMGRPVHLRADLLVLATAVVPNRDDRLARFFKVPVNAEGFFVEKHAKLGPSEFATDGVYLCGMAHYSKPIDESIAQGRAAASRAITLLARETIHTSGTVAVIDPAVCSSCGICVSICPYSAPAFIEPDDRFFPGRAKINPVLCKGCGLCVASCRSGAIRLNGFDNDQLFEQISAVN